MNEFWKDIKGYEGLYQVSNLCRVKTLHNRYKGVEILKNETVYGYQIISLHKDKVVKTHRIHRLVAQAFIDNPKNKPQVNHINGIKSDNRAVNLEWVTQSENMLHCYRTGLEVANTEPAHKARRILSNKEVENIRQLLNSGLSTRKVASMVGVGKTLIGYIKQNKSYKEY